MPAPEQVQAAVDAEGRFGDLYERRARPIRNTPPARDRMQRDGTAISLSVCAQSVASGVGPCPDPPRPAGRPPTRGPSLSLRRSETVVERSKHSYREKTGFLRGGAFPFFRVSTNRPLVHTDSPSREGGLREVGRIVNRYKSPAKNGSRTDQELSVGDRPRTAPDCSSTAPLGDAGCGPRVALVEKRPIR